MKKEIKIQCVTFGQNGCDVIYQQQPQQQNRRTGQSEVNRHSYILNAEYTSII